MPSSVSRWIGAAIAAVLVAVAFPAITAGHDSDIIYACFKAQSGQVRFVSAPSECLPSETTIPLNQTGVQGPQGAEGPEGPQGPPGPADILPPVGEFTPTQLVQGAIVTCENTGFTGLEDEILYPACLGLKVNGMLVRHSAGFEAAHRICKTVTGGLAQAAAVGGAAQPTMSWTGTTWTLSAPATNVVLNLLCTR